MIVKSLPLPKMDKFSGLPGMKKVIFGLRDILNATVNITPKKHFECFANVYDPIGYIQPIKPWNYNANRNKM